MPLEQLMPAPEITTARLLLATAVDTSKRARRWEKSSCSVEESIASRGSEMMPMLGSDESQRTGQGKKESDGRVSPSASGSPCSLSVTRWLGPGGLGIVGREC